jgi:hypothetical protein
VARGQIFGIKSGWLFWAAPTPQPEPEGEPVQFLTDAGQAVLRAVQRQRPGFQIPRISLRAALLACLGITAVTAAILYAMGRIPMCKCGYVKLWHGGRGDSEMSQHIADWYTYSHVLHGVIFYWLLTVIFKGRLSMAARLVIATVIEAGWEILENSTFIINRYRAQTISRDYYGDAVINSVADIAAMMVGFLIAARLPAWVTVFLVIATEVVLLYVIRDNLILNVVMLIYPVEWIKQWQLTGKLGI